MKTRTETKEYIYFTCETCGHDKYMKPEAIGSCPICGDDICGECRIPKSLIPGIPSRVIERMRTEFKDEHICRNCYDLIVQYEKEIYDRVVAARDWRSKTVAIPIGGGR